MLRAAWAIGMLATVAACREASVAMPVLPTMPIDGAPPQMAVCEAAEVAQSSAATLGDCRRDGDCIEGACARHPQGSTTDAAPLTLHCASPLPDDLSRRCDVASECSRGLCALGGTCVKPCAADADCAALPGTRCAALHVRAADQGSQRAAACVPRFQVASGIATSFQAEVMPLAFDAAAQRLELLLPPVAAPGAALHVLDTPCDVQVSLLELETLQTPPRSLFDASAVVPGAAPPLNPLQITPLLPAVLLPSGAAEVGAETGYRLSLRSTSASPFSLSTLAGRRFGGILDLDVFYVGAPGWDVEGERGPPELAQALASFAMLLAPAGITLGEVRQHRVGGQLRDRLSVIEQQDDGSLPELAELFRLSAAVPGASVSLFFVRSVAGGLAFAGGIPGAVGLPGTVASGVVVGMATVHELGFALSTVLAHEIGHFLGLFHTVEANGLSFESLPDTPACTLSSDMDGDGVLSPQECLAAGADNLMFWRPEGTQLTPMQLQILSSAFILR